MPVNITRLQKLRKEAGLTQTALAARLGVQRSTISNWEIGRRLPCNSELIDICTLFDVSVDYLCGRVDTRNEIIAPPSVKMDLTLLDHDELEQLVSFYDFLIYKKNKDEKK